MIGHIRVPVDVQETTVSTRPHKWSKGWQVSLGSLAVTDTSKARAHEKLAGQVAQFVADHESPRMLTYGDKIAVLYVMPCAEGPSYAYDTYHVDGRRTCGHGTSARSMRELDTIVRGHLAQAGTDFLDDKSVHQGAAFIRDDDQRREHYRYAAWQRAAHYADVHGEPDVHRWATEHDRDERFQVTQQEVA